MESERSSNRLDWRRAAWFACALAAIGLGGCAAFVAALPSGASITAHAAAAKAALAATPEIVPAGAALGAVALSAPADPDRILGMSRANLETCAGFTNRTREPAGADTELWHYDHRACRVSVTLASGYVTKVEYSRDGGGGCASVLQYCR